MIKGRLVEIDQTAFKFNAYDSACSLLFSMDKLCRDNADHTTMMVKPYVRLV